MAEKSLFYNALPDAQSVTGYDRNYNGDDLSTFYSIIWENGVVKDTLQVETANDGLKINVNVGYAAIKGKGYYNDSIKQFTLETAPTSSTRYDYVVLRYNKNIGVRSTNLYLITGNSSIPNVGRLTRSGDIYELMLAYIQVGPNATTIAQDKIVDERGDTTLCPWFTAVKGYEDYYDAIVQKYEYNYTLPSTTRVITTNLTSSLYNSSYSIITVFTNGIKEQENAYTVSTSGSYIVITFTSNKSASTKINVVLSNFIDGEGLSTAISQYSQWAQAVEELEEKGEYIYLCNGVNDNILIGNLVRTFLNAGSDYASAKIIVKGTIGMQAPAGGSGTTTTPYYWFNFNTGSIRHCSVDFSSAGEIRPTIANGTQNNIFHSNNSIDVVGARIIASNQNTDTVIRIMNTIYGAVYFEKCYFNLEGYKDSLIAYRGTFTNCKATVTNEIGNSYCFIPNTNGIVKLNGGEYYAYTGLNTSVSAVIGQSGTNAVSILYGVSAPAVAKSGYYQTNCLFQTSSGGMINCTDLMTTLTMQVVAGMSNIRGTIAFNKPNVM